MTPTELLEIKLDKLLKAIRRELIEKRDAYSQFVGYTKAFHELGLITAEQAKEYRLQLAKVLF